MTQTTGSMSAYEMYVGLSTDNSTWTDVTGYANSVEVSGGELNTGAAYTFDGSYPIIKRGKLTPLTVTIRGIYTEEATKFYALAKTAYEAGSALYARWSPKGGDSGEYGYTTALSYVKNPPYPGGAADSADPILVEIVLETSQISQSTIGTAGW